MEALRNVAGRYGNVTKLESYGGVTERLRNVTEPLRKIPILPITNSILNFAHH